jgi:hypothetical protein
VLFELPSQTPFIVKGRHVMVTQTATAENGPSHDETMYVLPNGLDHLPP